MGTQDPVTVVNIKVKKKNKKKMKKKQKKGLERPNTESDGESVDLNEKLYPLAHYITDQEELVNQMFTTIHGAKLEAMLPPVLKSVPLMELKKLCLHELRGMSKKRILACINGQVMEGSSGSEDEDEDEEEEQAETANKSNEKDVEGKRKQVAEEEAPDSYLHKKIKVEPGTEDNTAGAGKSSDAGKSVLELLELEMRARIIKTMLEKGPESSKIAEDAIAAVMESAKQITGEDPMQVMESANRDETGEREDEHNDDKGVDNEEVRSRNSRKSRRRRHTSNNNERRRRGHARYEGNQERKSRERKSLKSNEHSQRKKITRKEFQERMKRAKKNRTYRQRKTSEDEEKEKENKDISEQQMNDTDNQVEGNSEANKKIISDGEKEEGEDVDGSEKEEGEIDSNEEEEEGACSPSDISSRSSYYSCSRSSSSRSRSRSYTRSPSPYKRKRSKSKSRSRSRGRSYSRSESRSSGYRVRRRKAKYPPLRNDEKKTKNEQHQSPSKKDERDEKTGKSKDSTISKEAHKPSQPSEPKEEEENWGQKCDIEFVDSDEDFDENTNESKKLQPGAVSQASERASVSFSLQKKPVPSITPNVDLDDLPRKKTQGKEGTELSDVGIVTVVKPPKKTSEEIVISSDSEGEVTKSGSSVIPSANKQGESLLSNQPLISDKTIPQSGVISDFNDLKGQPESSQTSAIDMSITTVTQSKKERSFESIMESKTAEKSISDSGGNEQVQSYLNSATSENITQNIASSDEFDDESKISTVEGNDSILREQDVQNNTSDSADKIPELNSYSLDTTDSVQEHENQEILSKSQETKELEVPVILSDSNLSPDDGIERQSEKLNIKMSETKGTNCDKFNLNVSEDKESPGINVEVGRSESKEISDSERTHNEKLEEKISDTGEKTGYEDRQIFVGEGHGHYDSEEKSPSENVPVSRMNSDTIELETVSSDKHKKLHANKESPSINSHSSIDMGTYPEITMLDYTNSENKVETENVQQLNDTSDESRDVVEIIQLSTENTQTQDRKGECPEADNSETTHVKDATEDFYRGADQLEFSDEDIISHDPEEFVRDDTPVEPIRIETGLIRKPVVRREKMKIIAPEISWTKREKKKKEKTKGQLAMEGIGLIKSTLAESSLSSSKEMDRSQCIGSDMDNLQSGKEHISLSTQQTREESLLVDINCDPSELKSDEIIKQGDQETEIIGVIETSNDAAQNPVDDMDLGGASWSMRWLQSEKVQKVVSSSKMLSRVRKKIQRKGKQAKSVVEKPEEIKQPPQPQVSVIGSIEEYERLFGMKVKTSSETINISKDSLVQEAEPATSEQKSETEAKPAPVFGSDDEGEDSEEEALWSKILKK